MQASYAYNSISQTDFFYHSLLGKTARIGSSAGLGILVTGMLLLLMTSLIAMDPPEIVESKHQIIDVVMPDKRDIENRPEPMVEKPVDPPPEPAQPKIEQSFDPAEGTEIVMIPTLDPVGPKGGLNLSSGSAMAIFKVAPNYPRRAISRGIEGYVELMFDITPTGKTENIRVIHAEPKGYFENASRKTLAKWKYKPAMEDGVAMAQKNQITRISYELDK